MGWWEMDRWIGLSAISEFWLHVKFIFLFLNKFQKFELLLIWSQTDDPIKVSIFFSNQTHKGSVGKRGGSLWGKYKAALSIPC